MKRLRFKSLTMRIWTTFTITILIIIFCISFLYLFAYRRFSENAQIQDLKVAHDIFLKSRNFNGFNRFDELRNLKGSRHFLFEVYGNGDSQIVDIHKKNIPVPPPERKEHDIRMWMASFIKDGSLYEKQFRGSYDSREFFFIISLVENKNGTKTYLISYMPNIKDYHILYTVISIGAIFIIIGFLTAKVLANYISKPLKEIEDYTVRIAQKNWKEPIIVKSDDEIGKLANSMNHMQEELKHTDEKEKLFLQNISHDLKTPVMVIMGHAEAIIDGVYVESVEKNAEIIRDEAIRLDKKIKQMLYLNTLDYALENNNNNIEINLHDLLLHIINRFEIINSKIEWNLDIDESITIIGDTDKIQIAIENILDNALRYADKIISVTLREESSFKSLEIYNDGPNIDSRHIDHVFDNLYKDKSGNFGLGLAISKKIIDFYGGKLIAVNRNKGVSFIIKFLL